MSEPIPVPEEESGPTGLEQNHEDLCMCFPCMQEEWVEYGNPSFLEAPSVSLEDIKLVIPENA